MGERLAELRADTNERLNELSRGQAALRSEMNALRSEMNERLNELSRGQAALRSEMNLAINDLRADMRSFRNGMLVLLGSIWVTTVAGFIALFTQL